MEDRNTWMNWHQTSSVSLAFIVVFTHKYQMFAYILVLDFQKHPKKNSRHNWEKKHSPFN